jgi:hypothetical protein
VQPEKINLKMLRRAVRKKKSIGTITNLARMVPCSRPAVYFAIENPRRFPIVYRRLLELVEEES